jgi:hypothetical protein
MLLNKHEDAADLEEVARELDRRSSRVPRLPWSTGAHRPNEPLRSTSSVSRPDDGPGSSAQMNTSVVVY